MPLDFQPGASSEGKYLGYMDVKLYPNGIPKSEGILMPYFRPERTLREPIQSGMAAKDASGCEVPNLTDENAKIPLIIKFPGEEPADSIAQFQALYDITAAAKGYEDRFWFINVT